LVDLDVDASIVKMDFEEAACEDVGRIHLVEDRVYRRAVTKEEMDPRFPHKVSIIRMTIRDDDNLLKGTLFAGGHAVA
jgi:hypothetical protein